MKPSGIVRQSHQASVSVVRASVESLVRRALLLGLVTGSLLSAGTAAAKVGVGPRLGVTLSPDQFHFGVHLDAGNFSPRVRFQPNLEVGVGDNVTIFAINFEAAYRFRKNWDVWTPYAGGGVGINISNFDSDYNGDDSSTDIGLNILGGIEKGIKGGDRFFLEAKLGLVDSPDFKITVGWTFM